MSQQSRNNPDEPPMHDAFAGSGARFSRASNTPRTDAESAESGIGHGKHWIDSHFARDLERELADFRSRVIAGLQGHPTSELFGDAGLIAATMRDREILQAELEKVAQHVDRVMDENTNATRSLWTAGLLPDAHQTLSEAVAGVLRIIAFLRKELSDPPSDVCDLAMRKTGAQDRIDGMIAENAKLREALKAAIEEARSLESNTDALVDGILQPALGKSLASDNRPEPDHMTPRGM